MSLLHENFSAEILVASRTQRRDAKKNNGPAEICLCERGVQADYKTRKRGKYPNICLSLLHDRFRGQSSTLRRLLCWRQQRHSVLGTKKAFCLEPCHRVPTAELKGPFIPVARRVKGYTRFVGKYVTGRRNLFRTHKEYIFLIRITSRVDLAMSVCPSDERWDLGNYKSKDIGIWHADSWASCAAQVCFSRVPRPL